MTYQAASRPHFPNTHPGATDHLSLVF